MLYTFKEMSLLNIFQMKKLNVSYNSQIKMTTIQAGGTGGMTAAMIENQEIDHLKIK